MLSVRRYGEFAVYSVDHYKALLFVREATLGVVEQLKYLEQRLVRDTSWRNRRNKTIVARTESVVASIIDAPERD